MRSSATAHARGAARAGTLSIHAGLCPLSLPGRNEDLWGWTAFRVQRHCEE